MYKAKHRRIDTARPQLAFHVSFTTFLRSFHALRTGVFTSPVQSRCSGTMVEPNVIRDGATSMRAIQQGAGTKRILYGICSHGLGHTMRARVAGAHLAARGHEVVFAASGRAAAVLRSHGFPIIDVRGLVACYRNGAVRRGATLLRALRESPASVCHNTRAALTQVKRFNPDVVVTDFSGFACLAGHAVRCPVISLDHQHVIDRFQHPRTLVEDYGAGFRIARAIVAAKTWGCAHYFVTSFYFPEVCDRAEASTTLLGPIIRPEIARLTPTTSDHVLVYQTAAGDARLLAALGAVHNVRFRVYGVSESSQFNNVELRRFDEQEFIRDLASARAVIANGGFTTISEALYLGKPVLSIPIEHQWEQVLNAGWLERLGFGMRATRASSDVIRTFLARLSEFNPRRDHRLQSGTVDACQHLERALAEVA